MKPQSEQSIYSAIFLLSFNKALIKVVCFPAGEDSLRPADPSNYPSFSVFIYLSNKS